MPQKTLTTRIILRNDTQANWNSVKPVLMKGEIGLEIDTGNYKIGDGTTAYDLLPLYSNITNSQKNSLDILITMLNEEKFGKVDDVQVNNVSVLGEDKIAKIVIGDLVIGEEKESFTGNITLHKVAKTGKYADLEGKPNTVDNLESTSITDNLSANQGRVLKEMLQAIPSGEAYSDIQTLVNSLNSLEKGKKNIGSNLYIQTMKVPDFWIYGVLDNSVAYTYTTDDAFINEIDTNGFVQVGYYQVAMLETEKVDLTNYYTQDQVNSLLSNKLSANAFNIYVGKLDATSDADGNFGYSADLYNNDGTNYATRKFLFNKNDFKQEGNDSDKKYSLADSVLRDTDTFILNGGNSSEA